MLKKSHTKGEKGDMEVEAVQATHEELRIKLTNIQIEYQQEKGKVCKPNTRVTIFWHHWGPGPGHMLNEE